MATSLNPSATADIVARATALFDDLSFTSAREWKAAKPSRKVIGYMPIYVPREIIHAADMLPLGIVGGGDQLEVIHGDAYYQSYICRIPRSTIELGVSGRIEFVEIKPLNGADLVFDAHDVVEPRRLDGMAQ